MTGILPYYTDNIKGGLQIILKNYYNCQKGVYENEKKVKMLGLIVRQAREEKNWTQQELADKMGIPVDKVTELEMVMQIRL